MVPRAEWVGTVFAIGNFIKPYNPISSYVTGVRAAGDFTRGATGRTWPGPKACSEGCIHLAMVQVTVLAF